MNLDQLITHLEGIRARHGGTHPAMLGQRHPDAADRLWSGVPLEANMIQETIENAGITSVPGYQSKAGWIWFEVPATGFNHRPVKR